MDLKPLDFEIISASVKVYAKEGQNILQLRGKGISDSNGVTVDNIRLVKDGSIQNLILNGGFEDPKVETNLKVFRGGVPGWSSDIMELGPGITYN